MAQLNPKTPPVLIDPEDYSNWRADLEIWEMFTDLDKKKRSRGRGNRGRESFQRRQHEFQKEDSTVNSRGGAIGCVATLLMQTAIC